MLLGGGVNSYCSPSFSEDCPFAYTFWRLINIKTFYTYQIIQKLLRIGVHLSNLVFWRGSWYKFSFCPYFESCSCTQASIWLELWAAQSHFPPSGTKTGLTRCHPGFALRVSVLRQSCQLLVLWICVRGCTTACPGFMAGRGVMWTCGFGNGSKVKQSVPVGCVNVFTKHLKSGKLCLQKTQTHTSPDQVLLATMNSLKQHQF